MESAFFSNLVCSVRTVFVACLLSLLIVSTSAKSAIAELSSSPAVEKDLPDTAWQEGPTPTERQFLKQVEKNDSLRRYFALHQSDSAEANSNDTFHNGMSQEEVATPAENSQQNRFDESVVRQGQEYFETSCTYCHDADRALSKRKSYSAWLATVRRMAAKEDAFIPSEEHVPIATYLASLNPETQADNGNGTDMEDMQAAAEAYIPPYTLNGTLSTVWRGTDPDVENKGFFPDVWVAAEWLPEDSPVSGKVEACTSCHGANQGLGVELVEASATLDLVHWFTRCKESERCSQDLQAKLKAGRFIVPFGAFSGRVHPGALRTASLPLMYNMGRRVGPISIHQPVLNLPYSDEGFNIHLRKTLPHQEDWSATLDVYGVNGLQNGGPGIFFASRSYRDNNSNVAVGARATIGNQHLKFGGSVASGELQTEVPGAALQNYKLAGGDISFRWKETVRAYYEYAIRNEQPSPGGRVLAYGHLAEVELLLLSDPQIGLLTRYDTLENHGDFGDQFIERFTWGFNFGLYGGSTLIVDHEHWNFDSQPSTNIMGIRWTTAF